MKNCIQNLIESKKIMDGSRRHYTLMTHLILTKFFYWKHSLFLMEIVFSGIYSIRSIFTLFSVNYCFKAYFLAIFLNAGFIIKVFLHVYQQKNKASPIDKRSIEQTTLLSTSIRLFLLLGFKLFGQFSDHF